MSGREGILCDEQYLDRVRGYHSTEAYKKALRKRQVWVEPLFAERPKTGMAAGTVLCST